MPSKLEQLQLQFRQRLLQEKEERMIKIHTDNQQKALCKVSKYNGIHEEQSAVKVIKSTATTNTSQPHHSPVKKGSPGVDRSRPLPPISKGQKNLLNGVDENTKTNSFDIKSKSVNPEPSHGASKGVRKIGSNRPMDSETKKNMVQTEKKQIHDLQAKKQAELQRLKANTKARERVPPKKGLQSYSYNTTSNNTKSSVVSPTSCVAIPKQKLKSQSVVSKPKEPVHKPPGPGQEQCRICGRNFNKDRIEKHVTICTKASRKKVKVFDATKMRVQGTEAETFVKKGLPSTAPKPKQKNWRKQHQEFIETIRQAKQAQKFIAAGGNVKDLPPPPPSDTSHYVQCPHCNRKFNEGVAERHIPKCKNILSNKKSIHRK